jgi:hypothetical protein
MAATGDPSPDPVFRKCHSAIDHNEGPVLHCSAASLSHVIRLRRLLGEKVSRAAHTQCYVIGPRSLTASARMLTQGMY